MAPIFEEILFRGVLYGALRSRFSVVQAAVVSSIIFAGVHGYGLVDFFAVTSSGFLYAMTYEYTRSLVPCAVAHGLHNLSVVLNELPYVLG